MKLLALSGSLRQASINTALCRAAIELAGETLNITLFEELGTLPLYNWDMEADPPLGIRTFRSRIHEADALIIASPEYAHGITGALKNALDWLVSFEGFFGKPVILVNTSPRAHHAIDSTREILKTMSARLVSDADLTIPLLGTETSAERLVRTPEWKNAIEAWLRRIGESLL